MGTKMLGVHAAACLAAALWLTAPTQAAEPTGELRLRLDPIQNNPRSAGYRARQLSEVAPPLPRSEAGVEADVGLRVAPLYVEGRVEGYSDRTGRTRTKGQLTEGYLASSYQGLQLSGGRRVVQWDVSFGFRPNDLIQQDPNRYLLTTKPQGRTVLQAEKFSADESLSLVVVNPENLRRSADRQRGGKEAAVAGRAFARRGPDDLYAFVRGGRRTGLSVGAAFVSVVNDAFAVHGSMRVLQRRDSWVTDTPDLYGLVTTNPWRQATLGRTGQLLLGANWTGQYRQNILVEWWYDGTAVSNRQWDDWLNRNRSLSTQAALALQGQPGPPVDAVAANLAWQDSPLAGINQRRSTVLLRLSWQPDPWLLYVDTLYNPVDSGRIVTAGLKWQGERIRVDAALRSYGGPEDSIAARLPQRTTGLLAATWSY